MSAEHSTTKIVYLEHRLPSGSPLLRIGKQGYDRLVASAHGKLFKGMGNDLLEFAIERHEPSFRGIPHFTMDDYQNIPQAIDRWRALHHPRSSEHTSPSLIIFAGKHFPRYGTGTERAVFLVDGYSIRFMAVADQHDFGATLNVLQPRYENDLLKGRLERGDHIPEGKVSRKDDYLPEIERHEPSMKAERALLEERLMEQGFYF